MNHFIDIHCHILPCVDDGAGGMEESLAMLRQAQAEGIGAVIVTPHQKPEHKCVSACGVQERIALLEREMKKAGLETELYPGGELLYSHDLEERLTCGRACALAGSHYILVEFLPDEGWQYIRNGLYDLTCAGYRPVIAHAERCTALAADTERIRELIDMGCYIQVNAGSITGTFGFGMKRAARRLLKEEIVHFVATDAHREAGKRSVRMKKCGAWLLRKCGREYAEELLWKNAEKILRDEAL